MNGNYRNIKAVKQIDETTCWAASLEWWLKVVGGRGEFTQEDLLKEYHQYWKDTPDGTITKAGMMSLVYDPRWRMNVQWTYAYQFSEAILEEHIARGPIYIGYYEKKVSGNHVNVIYQAIDKGSYSRLKVMEPNGGKHKIRNHSYYQGIGEIIIASPKP